MADHSMIEWAHATCKPLITGYTKVSPGCKHCYASWMACKLKTMGQPKYTHGIQSAIHQEDERALHVPLQWKQPRRIFVNSMTDLCYEQLLIKRSERLLALNTDLLWPPLQKCVTFLSLEPLVGPLLSLDLEGIDGVIVGDASGPRARIMHACWVRVVREQSREAMVPSFFKQWGSPNKHRMGWLLDGCTWGEMPSVYVEALRQRQGAAQRTAQSVIPQKTLGLSKPPFSQEGGQHAAQ